MATDVATAAEIAVCFGQSRFRPAAQKIRKAAQEAMGMFAYQRDAQRFHAVAPERVDAHQ